MTNVTSLNDDALFKKTGIHIPHLLLPSDTVDIQKWSVIACDQYTSQKEYWESVQNTVGDAPSTLHLIYPEAFLEDDDREERIARIGKTMKNYLEDDIFTQRNCMVLLDRKTPHTPSRKGLITALDLEAYQFTANAKTMIRGTEGTVLERIPPRFNVRVNAPLELSHIMVLIDDPEHTVIEPLFEESLEKIYDFDLMMSGGHLTGYALESQDLLYRTAERLDSLKNKNGGRENLLFAVGDGNHSLATAKRLWEHIKNETTDTALLEYHPARYAMVEIVNLHDEGLGFEPIHRLVENVDPKTFLSDFVDFGKKRGQHCTYELFDSETSAEDHRKKIAAPNTHTFIARFENQWVSGAVSNPSHYLMCGVLDAYIDDLKKKNTTLGVDYIHGKETLDELSSRSKTIGFYLPSLSKHSLFDSITENGLLPRKTFSIGEADEKRYYLECRRIMP